MEREVVKTLGWENRVTSDRVFLQLYKDRNVTVASQNLYIFLYAWGLSCNDETGEL